MRRAIVIVAAALGCARAPEAAEGEGAAPEEPRLTAMSSVVVPDEELVDQDGRAVRLRALFADKVVAVNLVFTTCTTLCSPMTAIFARLQDHLGPALERDVRLVSISLDPATDTPARLHEYASRFDRRAGWTFLTGPPGRVAGVLRALGGQPLVREGHRAWTLLVPARQGAQRVDGLASPAQLAAWIGPLVPR